MKLKSNREYWNELQNRLYKPEPLRIFTIQGWGLFNQQMQFIGQEPKLEMFVNMLEKPKEYENLLFHIEQNMFDGMPDVKAKILEYQQAEDKKIFKGWEWFEDDNLIHVHLYRIRMIIFDKDGKNMTHGLDTLESFIGCELTEQGIKQVGYDT